MTVSIINRCSHSLFLERRASMSIIKERLKERKGAHLSTPRKLSTLKRIEVNLCYESLVEICVKM